LGVGYEIGYAEKLAKPILCLYQNSDKKISAMVNGNKCLDVRTYNDIENVKEIINNFTKNVDKK
jgi:hypothetical protein